MLAINAKVHKRFVKLNFSRHNRLNNFVYGRIILKDNILQNRSLKRKIFFLRYE